MTTSAHAPSAPHNDNTPFETPTNTRFSVLGMLSLLAGVLYLDRICISAAIDSIQKDLNLTNTEISYVMISFTIAYGMFEIPTGRWGDQIGSRRVLTRISIWWSIFTALTGSCTGLVMLIIVRFLFGAGEAGAFPNSARVLSVWFPDTERGRAQGIMLAASQVGGALSPFLAALLINSIGWRWTFVVFGSVGLVWAAFFYWWFRDNPADHPQVNRAEAELIGQRANAGPTHEAIPWALVVRNPSVWFLGTIMTLASFNSYIYFSWFPKYLMAARGVTDLKVAGFMSSVVLAFAAVGTFTGGIVFDRYVRPGGIARRRLMGGGSFFFAALMLAGALWTNNVWLAVILTGMSCFATQGLQPLWWSCTIGISGRHVGALFGLMNSMGVVGGALAQYIPGALADSLKAQGYSGRDQWDPIFYINLGVLAAAGIMWSLLRFVPVEPDEHTPALD